MPFEISIDADRCMGSGNCLFWAPSTFELADDPMIAFVTDPAGDDDEKVLNAARGCPTKAITLTRDGAVVDLSA